MFVVCEIIPVIITLDSKSVEIFTLEGRLGVSSDMTDSLLEAEESPLP